MNTVLWIAQAILALMFLLHGWTMLTATTTVPQEGMAYVLAIPLSTRRLIGVLEILAAAGLILPGLLNILPALTFYAAAGLVLLMIGAIIFHIPRREYPGILLNLILLILAAFVMIGRYTLAPL